MDEAEILCSRIAIMVQGRLWCIGQQQKLKNQYGKGYILTINFDPENKTQAHGLISRFLPSAQLLSSFKGTSQFQVLSESSSKMIVMSQLFETLEQVCAAAGIKDWSLSQIGLQMIFEQSCIKLIPDQHRNPNPDPKLSINQ